MDVQRVKWKLLSHRRREMRHRAMAPQGIAPPTKWTGRWEPRGKCMWWPPRGTCCMLLGHDCAAQAGMACKGAAAVLCHGLVAATLVPLDHTNTTCICRVVEVYAEAAGACCPFLCFSSARTPLCRREEAYEEVVAQLGGIHRAQPKMVLERLQPEFPDLTLEVGWARTPTWAVCQWYWNHTYGSRGQPEFPDLTLEVGGLGSNLCSPQTQPVLYPNVCCLLTV